MTSSSEPEPDGIAPRRWPRWLPFAALASLAGIVVIIVVVTSGGDDTTTGSTALTTDSLQGSAAPNSSAASSTATTQPTGSEASTIVEPTVAGSTPGLSSTTAAAPTGTGTTVPGDVTTAPVAPAIALGQADVFAVLGNTSVESSGATTITGQVGASNGPIHGLSAIDNPAGMTIVSAQSALVAQRSVDDAVADIDGGTSAQVAGVSGQTIGPGSRSSQTLDVGGTLTLDGAGDPNAVFVFITTDTLSLSGSSKIVLTGGAQACNVFWHIGSSATLGTGSIFVGTLIAEVSITAASDSNVDGRLIARSGSITLDSASIAIPTCT